MIALLNSDARYLPFADQSVHCAITSPPYYGLRDYKTNGQIGLERTPQEYIDSIVACMREVWRVLRDDGTLWLNLGDSYVRTGGTDRKVSETARVGSTRNTLAQMSDRTSRAPNGLKPKDLCMIPARVALALQADGWYLRSDIIWAKSNPMPESVTTRPTKAHEYVYLLAKSERYFYDAEAIKEPAKEWTGQAATFEREDGKATELRIPGQAYASHRSNRKGGGNFSRKYAEQQPEHGGMQLERGNYSNGRNKRSVWTVATKPYSGAHFAVFPEDLVEPMILAGTSARGCCPACAAPWVRVVEKSFHPQGDVSLQRGVRGADGQKSMDQSNGWQGVPRGTTESHTLDWRPSCDCDAGEPIPCTVLDPFSGTATVGRVCARHGRRFVGVELNKDYIALAHERTSDVQMELGA